MSVPDENTTRSIDPIFPLGHRTLTAEEKAGVKELATRMRNLTLGEDVTFVTARAPEPLPENLQGIPNLPEFIEFLGGGKIPLWQQDVLHRIHHHHAVDLMLDIPVDEHAEKYVSIHRNKNRTTQNNEYTYRPGFTIDDIKDKQ